jgi:hypothetical protein
MSNPTLKQVAFGCKESEVSLMSQFKPVVAFCLHGLAAVKKKTWREMF